MKTIELTDKQIIIVSFALVQAILTLEQRVCLHNCDKANCQIKATCTDIGLFSLKTIQSIFNQAEIPVSQRNRIVRVARVTREESLEELINEINTAGVN